MYPKIIIWKYMFNGEGLFTFLAVVGAFLHIFLFVLPKSGYSRTAFINGFLFSIVLGVIGTIIMNYLIWDFDLFSENPSILLGALEKNQGSTILGGILGLSAGVWIFCRFHKINALHALSSLAAVAPILWMGLGRTACFLNGDAFGKATSSVLGVTFSEKSSSWMPTWVGYSELYKNDEKPLEKIEIIFTKLHGVGLSEMPIPDSLDHLKKEGFKNLADLKVFYPDGASIDREKLAAKGLVPFPVVYPKVHPTQIYDMISLTIWFFILNWLSKKKSTEQRMIFLFFAAYGLNRFWIEFFRDDISPGVLGLTGAQLVCLGFISFGLGAFYYYTKKWEKTGLPEVIFI
ncbi:MAG TPA: prolipoprotein diacylglyceryl transferase [Leptospiraceae bacterium]|nr:prolipoprotein diacylglyceryl transferase [Leptospiraceae bacterium]HNN02671.1 prolipoprotein diacylglyceryl transferase [Leptospiraceae bacterium]